MEEKEEEEACFLPGWTKDLPAPPHIVENCDSPFLNPPPIYQSI